MTVQIKHRFTGAVLHIVASDTLRGADLRGAYLGDADLGGADLRGADLRGAYLGDADLGGADLRGAYLRGADLGGAYLGDADLGGYDLKGHVDPATPYIRKAPEVAPDRPAMTPEERVARRKAARSESAARFRERNPSVPVVAHLDAKILDAISVPGNALDMKDWHSCDTTHCRGGWAVHLAGPAGYALEKEMGSAEAAARAIYRASTGRVPHFYATGERAMEDIRRCAAEDTEAASP
jgi:hypothetical protein